MGEVPEVFTEVEIASLLGLQLKTLKKNRCLGKGHPPYKKLGRRIVYPKLEFKKWYDAIPLTREVQHGR